MKKLFVSLLVILALVFSFFGKVSAVDVPAVPVPVIPANGAVIETGYPIQVTLVWVPVSGATGYNVVFAATADFVSPIFSAMTTANQQVTPYLNYGVSYFWKVQAINSAGTSAWSANQTFILVPRTPVSLLPVNGAVFFLGSPVNLSWQYTPPYPSWFGFMTEVAYEPTFAEPYIVARGVTTNSNFVFNPPGMGNYFWRVKVMQTNPSISSPWSEVRVFRVTYPSLTIPIPTSPGYNALITTNEVTFSWSAVPYASTYQIQVQTGGTNLDQTYYGNSFSMTIVSGQRYAWKVRAGNVYEWGPWSNWVPFRCLLTPGVVTLTTPANDFAFKKIGVTLTWQSVATATNYQVCLTDEVTGRSWIFNPTVSSLAVQTEYNHYYSWKVVAQNEAGQSPWSATRHFSVLDMTPPELSVNTLPEWTNKTFVIVSGKAIDNESGVVKVTVNDREATIGSDGGFNSTLAIEEGMNTITITAYDKIGNFASKQVMTKMDTIPPAITITRPLGIKSTVIGDISVEGKVVDAGGIKNLVINNNSVTVDRNGYFSYPTTLNYGPNQVYVSATDLAGNQSKVTLTIVKEPSTTIVTFQVGNPKMGISGIDSSGQSYNKWKEIDSGRNTIPLIRNDRMFIPIRAFVEALDGEVFWDSLSQKITIIRPKHDSLSPDLGQPIKIELWIRKSIARITNYAGETHYIEIEPGDKMVMPFIANGRSYFPLRFIAENFGISPEGIQWAEELQMVRITYSPYPIVP
ncbi:MAG: stalk domain-containing protein [Candidatus Parcubacteria bacterium]|nr:stalk domain-containing protein [Candidatus Parcubacteria bacterium]